MAAPTFGSAGNQLAGNGSTMPVDVPDGVAAGDIIVVWAFVDGAATVTDMPTGFAHAPGSPVANPGGAGNAGQHSLIVAWKRATGADSTNSTYTFGLSESTYRNAIAVRYTGVVSTGSPWDDTDSAIDTALGTAWPSVSVTTTGADRLGVAAATNWSGGAWTPPTGWTERLDAGDRVHTVVDRTIATAQTVTSSGGSCAGSDRRTAWMGALLPEGGSVDPATGTAGVGLSLSVAAGGSRRSAATAGIGLGADISAAGSTRAAGTGAAALDLAVNAAGSRDSAGQAAIGLSFDLAAVGHAPGVGDANGSAAVGLNLAVAAGGSRASAGTLAAGIVFDVAAAGSATHRGGANVDVAYVVAADGPDTGVVFRPDMGIIVRPDTGVIVRPDTGVVTRP